MTLVEDAIDTIGEVSPEVEAARLTAELLADEKRKWQRLYRNLKSPPKKRTSGKSSYRRPSLVTQESIDSGKR